MNIRTSACEVCGRPQQQIGRGAPRRVCSRECSIERRKTMRSEESFAPAPHRFASFVRFGTADQCWTWTGHLGTHGYGTLWFRGKQWPAHRVSHVLYKGEIPDGLHIDHICRNRACVNPLHIEAVTQAENNARALIAKRNTEAAL